MGTRSSIAIQNDDGSIESVYCHWDGYLSHNGEILLENYSQEEKVRQLIALGNISNLGPEIGVKHDFNQYTDRMTTFYGRDRGEENQAPDRHPNANKWLKEASQEYNYLFIPSEGWLVDTSEGLEDLQAAIRREKLGDDGDVAEVIIPIAPPFEGFDPIKDEKKEFTLHEWIAALKFELDLYEKEWTEKVVDAPGAIRRGLNDYHNKKHTWTEWVGTFIRYMSW